MDFLQKHKLKIVLVVLALFLIMIIRNGVMMWSSGSTDESEYVEDIYDYEVQEEVVEKSYFEQDRDALFDKQDELEIRYGSLPDGFIWSLDGELLSLGDKSLSVEEVLYAYFSAVASLDISTIQRYSRNSSVVKTYSSYFDSTMSDYDYKDQFIRNMYKECMLSLQIEKVLSTSVFAENKVVFTVQAKILDLTDKDFWKDDRIEIYKNLYMYKMEDDSTKGDIYLYDYILEHYRSDDALLREVNFDITCQRYTDVDSGWLVSIDSDVDNACIYKDGNLVVTYIKTAYQDEAYDLFMNEDGSMMSYDQVINGNFSLNDLPTDTSAPYPGVNNTGTYDNRGNLVSGNGASLDRTISSYNGTNIENNSQQQTEELIDIIDGSEQSSSSSNNFMGDESRDYSSFSEFEIFSYDEFN